MLFESINLLFPVISIYTNEVSPMQSRVTSFHLWDIFTSAHDKTWEQRNCAENKFHQCPTIKLYKRYNTANMKTKTDFPDDYLYERHLPGSYMETSLNPGSSNKKWHYEHGEIVCVPQHTLLVSNRGYMCHYVTIDGRGIYDPHLQRACSSLYPICWLGTQDWLQLLFLGSVLLLRWSWWDIGSMPCKVGSISCEYI